MNNLAVSYAALGRHTEAVKLIEETLALERARLGPDHPETLRSLYNLARSYAALGRTAEALKLREETLSRRKAKLGPNHPDTLLSMNNLADSYTALGRHADAFKLRQETLALQKTKLGPDHPETLASMNNLALSYAALGRYAEALKLFEKTLALHETKLGAKHPRTLLIMYNLACIHALMIPESPDHVKQADLAMRYLQKAVAAGYKDIALIKKDTDLDALRGRADFNKLISDLEAKLATEKSCSRADGSSAFSLRAGLDAGNILVGNAEHAEDDQRGQVPGQVADQVGPAPRQALREESPAELPDERLHGCDALRVKATLASRRSRLCRGGSMFVSVGIGRKPPSARRCPAAGQTGWSGARVLAAENTLGVWKMCRMSS
jgi:tetratricopeptide (TPR) repeat protein